MNQDLFLQSAVSLEHAGRVVILEAPGGRSRRALLDEIPLHFESAHGRAWSVSCDFHQGGLWAGINDVFRSLSTAFLARRPDLVQKHDYELVHVLPELRRSITVRNPTLTDTAPFHEKVRNYPADRAFRIVQGLIDFLDAWKTTGGGNERWLFACDGFDAASHTGRRFFRELMRRRGAAWQLTLLVAVEPGQADAVAAQFQPSLLGPRYCLDFPMEEPHPLDPEEATRQALALEDRMGSDRVEIEIVRDRAAKKLTATVEQRRRDWPGEIGEGIPKILAGDPGRTIILRGDEFPRAPFERMEELFRSPEWKERLGGVDECERVRERLETVEERLRALEQKLPGR